jgi:nucleoside-diphosphate-sugar epimerase
MRVIITGHLGYIGPIMVRVFKSAGHEVTGLDIGYFVEFLPSDGLFTPHHEICRDIRDVTLEDLRGYDAVVHLAGLSNDPLGALNPELTYDINHRATIRLADLCKKSGISRFIFASSCSIYGAAADESSALDESAPFNPVSAYAVSKVRSEADLAKLADDRFSPVFLRNATAYGVSPGMRFDLVLSNLFAWARTTGTVQILSDGTPWRPLAHIEDISRAALSAVQADKESIHAQAFNIGRNDANFQVREIAEIVQAFVPEAKVKISGETGGDPRSYRVNFDKALNHLPGFKPRWTVAGACAELKEWFDRGGLRDDDFQSRRFIRLKQLRHLMDTGRVDPSLRLVTGD